MIDTELTLEPEVSTPSPEKISQENLMNFLDYTVLMLSQVNTVDDMDLIMDDFMAEDVMQTFRENSELFSILSIIWLNTFERVLVNSDETAFPLKVLKIPVLFREFHWTVEDKKLLSTIHTECLLKTLDSDFLYHMLTLLFIEGIALSEEEALANFRENVKKIVRSEEDELVVQNMMNDIQSLGWRSWLN